MEVNMNKVVIKILQDSVLKFFYRLCTGTKNYASWLAVDKVIAIIKGGHFGQWFSFLCDSVNMV